MGSGRALFIIALAFVLISTGPLGLARGSGTMNLAESSSVPVTDLAPTVPALPQNLPTTPGDARPVPNDTELATVIVATTNVADLAAMISHLTGEPVRSVKSEGFGTPMLTIPRGMIDEIRRLPSTVSVFDYTPPTKQMPDDPDTRDLGVMLDRIRLTIPVSRAAGGSP